jgi:hypothetical protein
MSATQFHRASRIRTVPPLEKERYTRHQEESTLLHVLAYVKQGVHVIRNNQFEGGAS